MLKLYSMKKANTGFTLVEIMVVTFIVSLLVSVAVVEAGKCRKSAQESYCVANLKSIASAFEVYAAGHAGQYAPGEESDLQFLIDADCLHRDFTAMPQLGNFRYSISEAGMGGYDIRAMALNPALSDHNYQIVIGGMLKRSRTAVPDDTDFEPLP